VQTKGLIGDKTYKGQHPASVTKDLVSEKISKTSKGFRPVFMSLKHISTKLA
jgi:hypothetical protein